MDRTELFRGTSYKTLLRQQQKQEVQRQPRLTWKFIAGKIRIQSTYLSRSFTHEDVHLGEDHLFEILELLRFDETEKDYLLLLRAHEIATSSARRTHLHQRIETMRRSHLIKVDSLKDAVNAEEIAFLMNPYHLLIYVSLHVKKYAKTPLSLARVFNLKEAQVKAVLEHLERMQLIRIDPSSGSVGEVKKSKMHFTTNHPLMRGHQQALRHLLAERAARIGEQDRLSFMATFSAPVSAYDRIKSDFDKFLNEAQKHAAHAEGEKVFQIAFDLFPWDD